MIYFIKTLSWLVSAIFMYFYTFAVQIDAIDIEDGHSCTFNGEYFIRVLSICWFVFVTMKSEDVQKYECSEWACCLSGNKL